MLPSRIRAFQFHAYGIRVAPASIAKIEVVALHHTTSFYAWVSTGKSPFCDNFVSVFIAAGLYNSQEASSQRACW
jgi:hypothetical protein